MCLTSQGKLLGELMLAYFADEGVISPKVG